MTVPEKPLHVLVAEATGWQDCERCGDTMAVDASGWSGRPPGVLPIIGQEWRVKVPRFDLKWEWLGPLIERYGIELGRGGFGPNLERWLAALETCSDQDRNPSFPTGLGPTPLIAVCNLLLSLAASGKLKEAP